MGKFDLSLDTLLAAVPFQVALLDPEGTTLRVSGAWAQFAERHGAPPPALRAGCDLRSAADEAGALDPGGALRVEHLLALLSGGRERIEIQIPWRSPELGERSLEITVAPLPWGSQRGAVVLRVDRPPAGEAPRAHVAESSCERLQRLFEIVPVGAASHDEPIAEGARRLASVTTDVSAQRRAEEALRESEERLRSMVDEMPVMITATDAAGRVVFWNRECEQVTGHGREVVLSHPDPAELLCLDQVTRLELLSVWRAEQGELRNREVKLRHREQGVRHVLWSKVAQRVPVPGWASWVIGVDVTERKQLVEQLQLAERMASIGTLAAGVAHEINNPLAFVTISLEVLAEELRSVRRVLEETGALGAAEAALGECEASVADARRGTDRVRQIVRGLKSFSRTDDIDAEERSEPVDIHVVLDSCIQLCTSEIRHRAQLVRRFRAVPRVRLHEGRIAQVFLNLLLNAAQAIPPGAVERNQIGVEVRLDDERQVIVEISDTGSGIRADVLPRIFDPFFTTKPVGAGTGLGLSICHNIVTGLGGKLEVETEVGRGSLFRVVLPAAVVTGAPEAPSPALPPVPSARILVIESEPMLLRMIARILGREHTAAVAESTSVAEERLRSGERFDMILCSLTVPDLSGIRFHEWLRELDPAQAERVVFMTGGPLKGQAAELLASVRNPRLDGPFTRLDVEAVLRELLANR